METSELLDGLTDLAYGPAMLDGVLDLQDEAGVELRGKDDDSKALRQELLERSLRGEHVELKATILAYGQGGNFSNRKHTRFTPAALQQYARAAGTTLFQRDHSMATADTGGVILGGKVEVNGDERVLHEELRLVEPWAVKAALLGTMRTFSIHWRPLSWSDVHCTVCRKPVFDRACMHMPGQKVETKAGASEVVYFEYQSAEPVETSWVTFPAVIGTGMERVEQALSAMRAQSRAKSFPTTRGHSNMDYITRLAASLGLGAGATEEQVELALKKLSADNAEQARSLAEKDAQIVKLRADSAAANKKALEQECSATIDRLLAEGKIRRDGEHEKLIREMYAQGNAEMAQRLAASFKDVPPIVPVGGWQSPGAGGGSAALQAPPAGADGKPNYKAIFDQLPAHIRSEPTLAGMDPEIVVRANAEFVRKTLGLNVEAL